jgi:hypothetical protein
MVVHTCNPSYSGVGGGRIKRPRPTWAKVVSSHFKNKNKNKHKKATHTKQNEKGWGVWLK